MVERSVVKNASDPNQVRDAKVKERFSRDRELDDLRVVLSSVQGRRFVWKVLNKAGVFRSSFTGDNATFFNEGRREIGLMIIADVMDADETAYGRMAKEASGFEVKEKEEERQDA